jgi:hypothetical protein
MTIAGQKYTLRRHPFVNNDRWLGRSPFITMSRTKHNSTRDRSKRNKVLKWSSYFKWILNRLTKSTPGPGMPKYKRSHTEYGAMTLQNHIWTILVSTCLLRKQQGYSLQSTYRTPQAAVQVLTHSVLRTSNCNAPYLSMLLSHAPPHPD